MINVLWDLDGTLVDSMPVITHCMNRTIEHFGMKPWPVEELRQFVGPGLTHTMAVLLNTDDQQRIASATEYYRTIYAEQMSDSPVFDGVEQVLKHFKETGVRQFLATAKYQGLAIEIIEAAGLTGYFTELYGSMKDGTLSDKKQLLAKIIAEEGIEPGHSIMIGDTHYDIEAGCHNGLTTIGVLWGYSNEERLKEAGAHYCASRAEELTDLVKTAMTCNC
ncbi:HAD family hydrolase [Reinekea thalattae]|uniref:HAD family hydrolase n=1 Tax=Reinekea thalattae TaxID=2593301 RepID=A0A5C8Z2Q9_9GAMM|nr:HAD hydrolase-like protein [Reinekea thalattae]TXR51521.1 HAD family hydrolase [Reinekea thalattae]